MGGAIGSGEGQYINVRDMFDGGGAGRSGPEFEGAAISGLLNMLGIDPLAAREMQAAPVAAQGSAPVSVKTSGSPTPVKAAPVIPAGPGVLPQDYAPIASPSSPSSPVTPVTPMPAGPGVMPMDYAPPVSPMADMRPQARPAGFQSQAQSQSDAPGFIDWLRADPHRMGVYQALTRQGNEAALRQLYQDWMRGALR